MSATPEMSTLNILGLLFFVTAFATIYYPLVSLVRSRLPSHKANGMVLAVEEVDGVYHLALEAGLLSDEAAQKVRRELPQLRTRANHLRLHALAITSFRQDFMALTGGLSAAMSSVVKDATALKAFIAMTSLTELHAHQKASAQYSIGVKAPPMYDDLFVPLSSEEVSSASMRAALVGA